MDSINQLNKNENNILTEISKDQDVLLNFNKLFMENSLPQIISEQVNGKIIAVNTAFLRKLHYKMSDVISKTMADLGILLENKKKTAKNYQENKRFLTKNFKIRTNKEKILNCVVFQKIIDDQNKKFSLTTIIDITDQIQKEEKLNENLKRQKMLTKITARLNRYKNFKNAMNDILKRVANHFGASRAYVFENVFDEKFCINTFEWCANDIKPRINGGQEVFFDESLFFLKNLNKKGIFISRDVSKEPIETKNILESLGVKSILVLPLYINNKSFGFIGFDHIDKKKKWLESEIIILQNLATSISSIYEKKQSFKEIGKRIEQVNQEKNKIETIVQCIGDAVFVVDSNLRILLINLVACQLSGYSEKEALNKKYTQILQFIHESDPQVPVTDFISRALVSGDAQSMPDDTLLISRNGKKIPVADSAVPLKDARGKIIGCVVVFRDATREREIDQMKSEFVSLASHQIKTPITGIRWMSELMLRENLSDKQREYMGDIFESIKKLAHLIDDLLNLSHIETGSHFNIIREKVDIGKIIEKAIKNNQGFAKAKKIDIKYKNHSFKYLLNIDCDKIEQVIGNIINNSIKFSPGNGVVEVDLKQKKAEAIIMIKDYGIGIPQVQQKRIFEKFFRANNVNQSDYGTGLGLSIAKMMVEANGGRIWFESEKGRGTIFYIGFPLNVI